MPPINIEGASVLVVGLGLHGGGVGTVRWLLRNGASVMVSDRLDATRLASSLQLIGPHRRLQWSLSQKEPTTSQIRRAHLIVVNPDVDRHSRIFAIARKQHIPLRVGDTSLFVERYPGPIIGVTGTRGKTTTAILIGNILKESDNRSFIGGNLRISPLEKLDQFANDPDPPTAVLELSSWQVEGLNDIRRSPGIAVITNIMPDHLNRYQSLASYARAKASILQYQQSNDVAILNHDDRRVRSFRRRCRGQVFWTSRVGLPSGLTGVVEQREMIWYVRGGRRRPLLSIGDLSLAGDHLIPNILSAIAAAIAAGIPINVIIQEVKKFTGVPGRLEVVREVRGVRYINDTTATIPEATIAAIRSVQVQDQPSNVILIAGGADKALSYDSFAHFLSRAQPKALILFRGDASTKILRSLRKLKTKSLVALPIITEVDDMKFAVDVASSVAVGGDVVLLSPAAASFGVFRHAYDRGDQFVHAVRSL